MKSDFVHLHCHTEFSTLDGMPKVEEYVIRAVELGMTSLALTEHGNMRSMYQFQIKTNQGFDFNGQRYDFTGLIKPIFGIEFYASFHDYRMKGMPESEKSALRRDCKNEVDYKKQLKQLELDKGYRARFHILAFAKNQVGLQNLFLLNYLSWKDGFYHRPRIDSKLLFKYHEGIIITTACIGGYAPEMVLKGKESEAEKWIIDAKKVFKDDLYVEIQPHKLLGDDKTPYENVLIQEVANRAMVSYANTHNIKIVATNDCHYLMKDDYESHNVLLGINSHSSITSQDAWTFGDTGFYMKSKDEMFQTFKKNHGDYLSDAVIKISLENTLEIAEKCNSKLEIDRKKGILPVVETKGMPEDVFLEKLCFRGWKKFRNMEKIIGEYAEHVGISYENAWQVYLDRMYFELKRIKDLKFAKYFLIIYDLITWARKSDIMVGPGRGSSSASLVCYLLGITSVDPLFYNLYFERFLAPGRIDYPDIDMDFEDTRRKEIFKYLVKKYGENNVCQIGTVGRMKGKQALQDVGRFFEVPHSETNKITKHIIQRSSGDARASQSVVDSFKEFDVCKEYNEKYPRVLKHVIKLEGKARQVGIHAAGIQIADKPMHTIVPIEYRETKDADGNKERIKVAGLDWLECQGLGLVKLDVLGLRTLSILKTALKSIKQRKGIDLNLEEVSLKDEKTLNGFTEGKFVGIFQFDSIGMTKTCEKLTFRSFEDVIALNALYRPGSMRSGLATHYINRAIGKEKIKPLHPIYDDICKETYGILVYQEQLIKCFRDIAGYEEATADELRKKIAKSAGVETLGKESDKFISGAIEKGMTEKQAKELFENMAFFGSYAFNKAHAAAYGMISYWGMYLKVHYSVEFFHALMRHEPEKNEILRFVSDARKNGLDVKTPDINHSDIQFRILDDTSIISGLVDIKGCGMKASVEIAEKQPYNSLHDLLNKVNRRHVHKGVIGALVNAGAFRSLYPSIGAMIQTIPVNVKRKGVVESVDKYIWEHMIDRKLEDAEKIYKEYDTDENRLDEEQEVKVMSDVCPIPPYRHKIEYYESVKKYIFTDREHMETYLGTDETYDNELEFGESGLHRTRGIFIGTLVDIKYNNVGDFHKDEPTEKEKKRIGWGKRYANVNIENTLGIRRINIDIDVFPTFRQIIDRGLQTPVLLVGNLLKWSEVIYADVIVDLDEFRDILDKDIKMREKYLLMNPFQKYLIKHPCSFHSEIAPKSNINELKYGVSSGIREIMALVTRVKWHWTKKEKKMAFVEIEDLSGNLSCILWPEGVLRFGQKIKVGSVIKAFVKKNKDGCFIEDNRKFSVIKSYWNLEGHIHGETSNKDILERQKTGQIKTDPTKYLTK